MFITWS